MFKDFKQLLEDEGGQGMVEYGLILALVAVVAIAILTRIGGNLQSKLTQVENALQ